LAAQVSGEPLFRVAQRARCAWSEISRHVNDGNILIISHGALINYFVKFLLSVEDYQRIHPVRTEPCSISEIIVRDNGNAKIRKLNDTRHLK
jgi:broad specificity phosphatase PhoE